MTPPRSVTPLHRPRAQPASGAQAPSLQSVRAAQVALRQFFAIAELWALTPAQQMSLLGVKRTSFFAFKRGEVKAPLDNATLERISYVFNIHEALHVLFSNADTANQWVTRPNTAPLFGGQPAIQRMTSGRTGDLYAVNEYLQGMRGAAFA
ncbi:MAG: MbcA/ParS/Xre antitoxin family protein [Aquabacterium sp.]